MCTVYRMFQVEQKINRSGGSYSPDFLISCYYARFARHGDQNIHAQTATAAMAATTSPMSAAGTA